ncbi:MAG: hypothetical protein U9Q81_00855 [Pseudomonadota bacterium]|nr:hypothetical protein [Pseudomonadota bacterium]
MRRQLGFININAFTESLRRKELLIARSANNDAIGFARFHHRRDRITTLYEIGVLQSNCGVGTEIIRALETNALRAGSLEIRLKCPIDLAANDFYRSKGYQPHGRVSEIGRSRRLIQWRKRLPISRKLEFVASFTSSTNDLNRLVRLWEQINPGKRPFTSCIVTPLFCDPGAFAAIRHIHDEWGVRVVFDSGGFFVQQGKIRYEDLYVALMDFYLRHTWAETYVLPDFVPTSKIGADEVWERVLVTAREGVRFFERIPDQLKPVALGVLQGHSPDQLEHCFHAYADAGVERIGFGSFDTKGGSEEINLLTEQARLRLKKVDSLLRDSVAKDRRCNVPALHLFGVGSPAVVSEFTRYGASSFDSSGWQRTAGYGNVYLPFTSRRNVTHGGSSITLGAGFDAVGFYRLAEQMSHSCPFCADFDRLQADRLYRMWHNAIVYREMVEHLNQSVCDLAEIE